MSPELTEEAIADFKAAQPAFVEAYLADMGIAPHERTARWDMIPEAIRAALPTHYGTGFGLSGGFGVGKTFAMSAIFRRKAETSVKAAMDKALGDSDTWTIERMAKDKRLFLCPAATWINWPESIARNRAKLYERNNDVEAWIQETLLDPRSLVFLDDIGAEPVTSQDWSGQLLARVIDERHRRRGVTCWTSNLDARGLVERYGPRTFSRLQALAPAIQLPKLPDQRLNSKVQR